MTALQLLILRTIHRHGPQTDMALWGNTRCESLTAVILATMEMEKDRLIEKRPGDSNAQSRFPRTCVYWQLTPQGQKIAGKAEQEQEVPTCN